MRLIEIIKFKKGYRLNLFTTRYTNLSFFIKEVRDPNLNSTAIIIGYQIAVLWFQFIGEAGIWDKAAVV